VETGLRVPTRVTTYILLGVYVSNWSTRRWGAAIATAVITVLVVAVPTAMIPTPIFGREVGVTWWSWPVLIVTAVLSGLVFATYVREPGSAPDTQLGEDRPSRFGVAGGVLTFFAVGTATTSTVTKAVVSAAPQRRVDQVLMNTPRSILLRL